MDTHIGSSPSTVLRQLQTMEGLLPEFQALCENQVESTMRESVVAMDETFFCHFLILVLMDLRSGYLILEDLTTDPFEITGCPGLDRKLHLWQWLYEE